MLLDITSQSDPYFCRYGRNLNQRFDIFLGNQEVHRKLWRRTPSGKNFEKLLEYSAQVEKLDFKSKV